MTDPASTDEQIERIAEILVRFGSGEFQARVAGTVPGTTTDKLAFVINITLDELAARLAESRQQVEALSARRRELEAANQALAEAHERMRQLSRLAALGELSAVLSHELSQPLATVSLTASLLLSDDEQPLAPEQRQDLRTIKSCTDRMVQINRNLARFGRNGPTEVEDCSLRTLICSSVELFDTQFRRRGIHCALPDDDRLPPVRVDALLCHQVFVNLLANARDAVSSLPPDEPRRIAVELSTEDGMACCAIMDNGPGIPDDRRSSIFAPFYTTKAPRSGTGLGLAISRDLVARMGGSLVLAEASDHTRFVVRLPLAPEPPHAR